MKKGAEFRKGLHLWMPGKIEELILTHALSPHPEGGYYRETYRSAVTFHPEGFPGQRNLCTAILFLIEKNNFSAFHRIRSDELWHFDSGDPLLVHIIHPDGRYECLRLGNSGMADESCQGVVPAGCWFASETVPGGSYSFVGCTVSPGFDFADFELAVAGELAKHSPEQTDLIKRLCR